MKIRCFIIWGLMVGAFLSACDRKRVYDTYREFPDATWEADSVQTFDVAVFDTKQNHNLYFNIRNDRDYPFSNLWLFVTIDQPGGTRLTDTVEVVLADPAGKWQGKGFAGVYDHRILYRHNIYFPVAGEYRFSLRHGMRTTRLKGITDVGIRVEKIR